MADVERHGPTALVFYKSTCSVTEMAGPPLAKLGDAYPGAITGVGQDPQATLDAFAEELGWTFPQVTDLAPYVASDAYGIQVGAHRRGDRRRRHGRRRDGVVGPRGDEPGLGHPRRPPGGRAGHPVDPRRRPARVQARLNDPQRVLRVRTGRNVRLAAHPPIDVSWAQMTVDGVYRTESGTVFKVQRNTDGQLRIETLESGEWVPAPAKMAGLRLNPTTKRLTARQAASLTA